MVEDSVITVFGEIVLVPLRKVTTTIYKWIKCIPEMEHQQEAKLLRGKWKHLV